LRELAGGHLLRDAAQPAASERRELRRQADRLAADQHAGRPRYSNCASSQYGAPARLEGVGRGYP